MCRDVDLPAGVLNILNGLGPEAGAPLASHPHVDKVKLILIVFFNNFFYKFEFYMIFGRITTGGFEVLDI